MWAVILSLVGKLDFKNIKTLLTMSLGVVLLLLYFSMSKGCKQSDVIDNYETILSSTQKTYEDEKGRLITEVNQWSVKVSDLKKLSKKDSSTLSDYEKKLYKIQDELNNSNRKLKQAQTALLFKAQNTEEFSIQLVEKPNPASDSIPDLLPLKGGIYKTDWTTQEYTYDPNYDSLHVSQVSEVEFFIDLFRQRELTEKGNKAFWPIRWLKPWEYKASIKSLKDSVVIKDAVIVNLSK